MFYYKNNGVKWSYKFVMYTHKIQQIGINEFNQNIEWKRKLSSNNYKRIGILKFKNKEKWKYFFDIDNKYIFLFKEKDVNINKYIWILIVIIMVSG